MPDSVLIGRLSVYGTVLSFRRDLVNDTVFNGIRTARMEIRHDIPSTVRIVGYLIRTVAFTTTLSSASKTPENHNPKEKRSVMSQEIEDIEGRNQVQRKKIQVRRMRKSGPR